MIRLKSWNGEMTVDTKIYVGWILPKPRGEDHVEAPGIGYGPRAGHREHRGETRYSLGLEAWPLLCTGHSVALRLEGRAAPPGNREPAALGC